MDWQELGSVKPDGLADARLQCHLAATLFARLGRGYVAPKPDDSHTNMGWDAARGIFAGREIRGKQRFRFGLDVGRLRLNRIGENDVEEDAVTLAGLTLNGAADWMAEALVEQGLEREPMFAPLHFDLPAHPVAHGQPFGSPDETFAELSRCYSNAALVIGELVASDNRAAELRCWPHHFDLATLITISGAGEPALAGSVRLAAETLGVGFSPGDGAYSHPYFYVSPWPYPEATALPALPGPGHWHTEGWTGAVLTLADLVSEGRGASQKRVLRAFVEGLHAALS